MSLNVMVAQTISKFSTRLVIFFHSFLLCFLFASPAIASQVLVEDFNDGNIDGWIEVEEPTAPCNSSWQVVNGQLRFSIIGQMCGTHLMPSDELWGDMGDNYEIELDYWNILGTDHNLAFRFTPREGSLDWYGFHFITPNLIVLERVYPSTNGVSNHVSYPFPTKTSPYHLKITVVQGRIEFEIDGVKVLDYQHEERFPNGRFAFRVTAGYDNSSITYFDNLKITKISENSEISIPYFSQTSEPWGDDLFDSLQTTISDVGCSVTSAVMILQSYGLDVLPNGTPLDPGSLNQWLIQRNRHGYNGGLNFLDIADISEEIVKYLESQGKTFEFDALQYHRVENIDYQQLDNMLSAKLQPVIFEEKQSLSSSGKHFTVARGVINSQTDYLISDPLVEGRDHFLKPPSQLESVRYFEPSNTNLSGLLLQADKELNISIVSPNGQTADSDSNNIDGAVFKLQGPIANSLNPNIVSGPSQWELDYTTPQEGEYTISLTTDNSGWYEFWLFAYNKDGDSQLHKQRIYLDSNQSATYILNYSQTGSDISVLTKKVSFAQFIEDIKTAEKNGWIKNHGIATSLIAHTKTAERFQTTSISMTRTMLDMIEKLISTTYQKHITEQGRQFLLSELHWLVSSL